MKNLKLVGFRKSQNCTQAEFAKIINVSTPTYINKENNYTLFSISELLIYKEYFCLSLAEWFDIFFTCHINNNESWIKKNVEK